VMAVRTLVVWDDAFQATFKLENGLSRMSPANPKKAMATAVKTKKEFFSECAESTSENRNTPVPRTAPVRSLRPLLLFLHPQDWVSQSTASGSNVSRHTENWRLIGSERNSREPIRLWRAIAARNPTTYPEQRAHSLTSPPRTLIVNQWLWARSLHNSISRAYSVISFSPQ
jgi:hypothetical protein